MRYAPPSPTGASPASQQHSEERRCSHETRPPCRNTSSNRHHHRRAAPGRCACFLSPLRSFLGEYRPSRCQSLFSVRGTWLLPRMHPAPTSSSAALCLYRTRQRQAGAAMTKQKEPPYPPVARRRSATAEDLEARRTGDYLPASPHRVGHTPGLHGEDAPYQSEEVIRPGQRTMRGNGYMSGVAPTPQRPSSEEEEEETHAYAEYPPRGRTTQRVYPAAKPTRRLPETRFHPAVFVGIGLFIMIIGWLSFSALSSWFTTWQDDLHYGRVRRFGGC